MTTDTANDAAPRSARKNRLAIIAGALIVVIIIATALWWLFTRAGTTKITAYFDKSVGIYSGSDVRILGVKVGSVDSVDPQGDQVKVVLRVDRGIDIPADAKAAQITPSLVSDRYVQLAPVYTGGDKMKSGAVISRDRTATPVEVDQLYSSIDQLSSALGPNGANKNGALTDLVNTGAANLQGNGQALGDSITQLSDAARTISDYRGDLFDTVKNLQVFVTALANNDQQVRDFNGQLSNLTGFLASEKTDLGAAIQQLSVSLGDVATFVANNRQILAKDVNDLVPTTQLLADKKQNLVDTLTLLPLALSNVANAYDAESGTLSSRANLNSETQDPLGVVCKLIDLGKLVPGDPRFDALGRQIQPLIDQCGSITKQIEAPALANPNLILPFGVLSSEKEQAQVVPGTVPGVVSPRLGSGLTLPGLVVPGGTGQ